MGLVGTDLAATSLALEGVVAGVGPSDADFGFEVPVFSEQPRVAVGYACAGKPTLIAVVGESVGVVVEKLEAVAEVADVVFTAE